MVINRHQRGRSRHDITSTRRSKPRVIIVSRSMIRASASETADDPDLPPRVSAFSRGLQELGWVDGRNVHIRPLDLPCSNTA